MATPQAGQLYKPTGAQEISQDFLDDLYLQAKANGNPAPPTQPGTDWYALSVAVANAILIQDANLQIAEDNADLLTSTGPALEAKRIAYGVPEVTPSPSSGKIRVRVNGSATIPDGRQMTLPNGLRIQASGTQAVIDKSEIDVIAIDVGTATNTKGGEKVTFISAPLNVQAEATVSTAFPLTGGIDTELDPRKLQRILNRLKYQPSGGNWAGLRDAAVNALASIQDVMVYPALGGPGSVKIVLLKAYDPDNLDFSRAPNSAQVAFVRSALQAANASESEQVVQAAADQDCTVALAVTIPDSSLSGGNGAGWTDTQPWPPLVPADGGIVRISAVSTSTVIVVTAQTTVLPIIGQTQIAWWSLVDRQFRVFTVVGVTGTAGAYTLQLDRPLTDSGGNAVAVGGVICPAAAHLADYGSQWLSLMGELGSGENTADSARLPRALRHPYTTVERGSSLTFTMLKKLADTFEEITSVSYSYTSATTPTVPASVDAAPNTLRLVGFGVYEA